jgi:hypothetical protein
MDAVTLPSPRTQFSCQIAAQGRTLNPEHLGSLSVTPSAHLQYSLRVEIFKSPKRDVIAFDARLADFHRN